MKNVNTRRLNSLACLRFLATHVHVGDAETTVTVTVVDSIVVNEVVYDFSWVFELVNAIFVWSHNKVLSVLSAI